MNSMIIALDMDEVIADAAGGLLEWYNKEHSTDWDIPMIWGKTREELGEVMDMEKIRSYLFEPGFFRGLGIVEGATEVLPRLYEKHEVYIATAAQQFPYSLREKYDWLDEHFPFFHWSRRIFLGDKHILGVDVLVDDHAHNFEKFKGKAYLFSAHHNQQEERYARINDWEEMERTFL